MIIDDGLDALRKELSLTEIMRLIERTARWVDRETFEYLPVWYPEYARGALFYKTNWSEPQMNTNRVTKLSVHKREGNRYANDALTRALGLRKKDRPNWSCCHVWGVDDGKFGKSNDIVQDPRYYSCIANMLLLPTPLKAFTDAMPEVKVMLRFCVRNYYGWTCNHPAVSGAVDALAAFDDRDAYPASWPRHEGDGRVPRGVSPFSAQIRTDADRMLARLARDRREAGPYYPADIQDVLDYWEIALPE